MSLLDEMNIDKKDYIFYKCESLVGIGVMIITIIFTFILYNSKIFLFMYCLSWYIVFSEIVMIYMAYKMKRSELND